MKFVDPDQHSRRVFIQRGMLLFGSVFCSLTTVQLPVLASSSDSFIGNEVFQRIMDRAQAEHWQSLPIGELMGKIAKEFEGTPYVGKTLDRSIDSEICSVDMTGLDCVTFFETTLCLARMLKKGGKTPADLLNEVRFTRYRGGKQGDYSSRLHYTTDWFFDNQKKGVVKILSDLPGAEPFLQKVGIISSHPELYKQIEVHPELLPKIKSSEAAINSRQLNYVPIAKLPEAEPLLKTGDIVGLCTDQAGIDISHTGLIYRDADNIPHFMDASSGKSKMKVTIEAGSISQALSSSKKNTGVMFARPLEPKH